MCDPNFIDRRCLDDVYWFCKDGGIQFNPEKYPELLRK